MARQEKKYHYIYKITCNITNRFYIGMHSTNNLDDNYFGSGKRLWNSLNHYGKENHTKEILEFLPNRQMLKEKEKEIVSVDLISDKLCMNIVVGGQGGFISLEGVKKGRAACNEKLKEKYGENYLSKMMKEHNSKLTDDEKLIRVKKIKEGLKKSSYDFGSIFRGKKHTEETKKIIGEKNSKHQQGEKNSQFGTCWLTDGKTNIKVKKNEIYLYPDWRLGRVNL